MTTKELIAQIRNALPPEGEFSNAYSDPIFHLAREAADKLEEQAGREHGKCSFGNIVIKPDGVNELDPCIYKDIEMYANVTVIISQCQNCGHVEISWMRQENTEEIPIE